MGKRDKGEGIKVEKREHMFSSCSIFRLLDSQTPFPLLTFSPLLPLGCACHRQLALHILL